jgi:hypothetical protein
MREAAVSRPCRLEDRRTVTIEGIDAPQRPNIRGAAEPRDMLSIIIATLNSERPLVPTLASLVAGATAGLVSEVVVADGGSDDETAEVADVAGCNFLRVEGSLGARLKAAADSARAPWLMFIRPGVVLDGQWTAVAGRFLQEERLDAGAATFQRGSGRESGWPHAARSLLAATFNARPQPQQGLVIGKPFYRSLGGHCHHAADPETELLRRIGRRRLVTLAATASGA